MNEEETRAGRHPDADALAAMAKRFMAGDMTNHERTIAGVAITIGINSMRKHGVPFGVSEIADAYDASLIDLAKWVPSSGHTR